MRRLLTCLLAMALLLCACGSGGSDAPWRTEKLRLERDGWKIAGTLYLPNGEGPHPVAVLCHGYGGSAAGLTHYAEFLAERGIAACVFDFIGGGEKIESDGSMTDMSVKTECADLLCVMDALRTREDLDAARLCLIGASQGGFVTTMAAAECPEQVAAMLVLYPGYGMQKYVRTFLDEDGGAPEKALLMGHVVGRKYILDADSVDLEACMRAYAGPVRIIHGTRDTVAPMYYSVLALKQFPDAELVQIQGAGHVFHDEDDESCMASMLDWFTDRLGWIAAEGA